MIHEGQMKKLPPWNTCYMSQKNMKGQAREATGTKIDAGDPRSANRPAYWLDKY